MYEQYQQVCNSLFLLQTYTFLLLFIFHPLLFQFYFLLHQNLAIGKLGRGSKFLISSANFKGVTVITETSIILSMHDDQGDCIESRTRVGIFCQVTSNRFAVQTSNKCVEPRHHTSLCQPQLLFSTMCVPFCFLSLPFHLFFFLCTYFCPSLFINIYQPGAIVSFSKEAQQRYLQV